MPNACCAYGCSMKSGTNLLSKVRFFTFPKDVIRRRLWQIAVRRANWTPTKSSRLCSFHFITGRPSKDKNHPDYVPTIFNHRPLPAKKTARKACRSAVKKRLDSDSSVPDSPPSATEEESAKQDEGTMTELTSTGIEAMSSMIEAQSRLIQTSVNHAAEIMNTQDWAGPPGKARWVVFVRGRKNLH